MNSDVTSHLLTLDSTATAEELRILGKRKLNEIGSLNPPENKKVSDRKKNSVSGQIILDEDEYTDKISSIIERDFFPQLAKLRNEVEYDNALREGNLDKMKEIVTRQLRKTSSDAPDLTLDSFQSTYTGEDNASFEILMNSEQKKRMDKLKSAYGISSNTDTKLISFEPSNSLTLYENNSDKDKGKAVEFWPHKPRNALMYNPEGTGSYLSIKSKEKEILHENTRVPEEITKSFSKQDEKLLQSISNHQSSLGHTLAEMKMSNFMTPQVGSGVGSHDTTFDMVPSTPAIEPRKGGATPLLTWGVIEGTPLLLDSNADDIKPLESQIEQREFKLPEMRRKEELAIKLSNEATKKSNTKLSAASPFLTNLISRSSSSNRIKMMSPAAQVLYKKSLSSNSGSSLSGFNHGSHTPSLLSKADSKTPIVVRKKK